MVLTSHTGDADLYIADVTNEIPPSFARPVHIGVYGHPNYILSTYTLEGVIVEDEEFDHFAQASYEENNEHFNDESTKGKKRSERSNSDGFDQYFKDGSPLRILFTILGGILEILLEILI